MIFDTHAHYDDDAFDEDREEFLAGMNAAGVEYIVNCFDGALSGVSASAVTTAIKVAVEFILFLLSFRIQREWVFSSKKK